ncbi:MAG TPA: Na+/H+ antiporter subunit E [Rhodoglobus sp.]|nr:Na+/H+ antiporter subunit E [Rhodoglobus sp.]
MLRRLWDQLPLLVGLVALWMLLWGSLSWLALLSGVLLAVFVTRAFYLPAVELSGRFNILWFLAFAARFAGELVTASFQVAWRAVRPGPPARNAVVAVDLVSLTDIITTATAIAVSLIPGSVVIDVDRERSILYLHVLGVDDEEQVERQRQHVLSVERSLIRAFGSRDELELVNG